ncbi:hypothetical protein [Brevundimonas goettingensis]|uniref:Uncharacterized protein n=1 Tax=Brevundimonas goettingensis TaxID=2774190 RepID=A0A975GV11_9CAUL|nr:hypothetical protein [Brevundimonas goettingensis]QTC90009.1 hypothetical protein IFJ75_11980 [Brevundimonas goettingensis]
MKPVAHRPSLVGPAFVLGGLVLGGCAIAALRSGVILSRHADITAANDPTAFFGTIALWALFGTILIGLGVGLVRSAPAENRRLDRYLADRHAARDESRERFVALPPSASPTASTPDDA